MAYKNDSINATRLLNQVEEIKSSAEDISQKIKDFDLSGFLNTFQQDAQNSAQDNPFGHLKLHVIAAIDTQPLHREALLQHAEEQAALSGRFQPSSIWLQDVAEEDRQFVLSALVKVCTIESSSNVNWLMLRSRRTELLRQLEQNRQLHARLQDALPPTDTFGTMLRKVLEYGSGFDFRQLAQPDLIALLSVIETISDTHLPAPTIADVKEHLGSVEASAAEKHTAQNFVGRDEELKRLRAFLNMSFSASGYDWQGLVVTGAGGAGKSALLTKFVSDVRREAAATVVWLDFDRPGVSAVDQEWLKAEISRQVGRQYPSIYMRLRQARSRQNADSSLDFNSSYSKLEAERSSTDILYETAFAIMDAGAAKKPLLIVLDTMEEVAQSGNSGQLLEWVYGLQTAFYQFQVKVIFSGRLYDEQLQQFQGISQVQDRLTVDAFDKAVARVFLQKEGMDAPQAEQVANLEGLPLRPLELKLVAKVLSDGKTSLAELSEDLSHTRQSNASSDLFAGLVYRRVLQRIHDPLVRELAYPGLILRYLTPEILEKVLLPTIRDSAVVNTSANEIDRLMTAFGSYAWLAYRDNKGALWHRKDLRRSMLRLMIAQKAEKADEIRNAAIDFFEGKGTPEAKAEAMYHRLMKAETAEAVAAFGKYELEHAFEYLSADTPDLPKVAATVLQYCGTRQVADTDVFLLPPVLFLEAYGEAAKRQVQHRNFNLALRLRAHAIEIGAPNASGAIESRWEEELLYYTGNWNELTDFYPEKRSATREENPVNELHNYLFPRMLLFPGAVDVAQLHDRCQRILKSPLGIQIKAIDNNPALLLQITCCLLLADEQSILDDHMKNAVRRLVHACDESVLWKSSRERFLLSAVAGNVDKKPGLIIRLANIRLDAGWLGRVKNLSAKNGQILHSLDRLDAILNHPFSSSKQLLGAIDGDRNLRRDLNQYVWPVEARTQGDMYELLAGPYPLLRDPSRYAIMELFPGRKEQAKLAGILQSLLPFKLNDLKPDIFVALMNENYEHALEPFIEIIDRSWMLGDLLEVIGSGKRANPKTQLILTVYTQLQAAMKDKIAGS